MGSYQHTTKQNDAQSAQQHAPPTVVPQPPQVQQQPVEVKSNEEGLAEHAERLRKLQRLGNSFIEMGPPRLDNEKTSPLQPKPWIQRKMTLGQPGDKYEQEADRFASQVVHQINAPDFKENNIRQSIQREKDLEGVMYAKGFQSAIQRKQALVDGEASLDLESAINSARGGGQPLAHGLQQSIGQVMGADFSGVRVHTDAQSDQLSQSIQARAFTTGQDVFFREGAYDPGSRSGQKLIAHELTHVMQQNAAVVRSTPQSGSTPSRLKPRTKDEIQRTVVVRVSDYGSEPIEEDPKNINELKVLSENELKIFKQWQSESHNKHIFPTYDSLISMLKKTVGHETYMKTRKLSDEEKNGQGIYVHAHAKKSFKLGGDRFYEDEWGDQVCNVDLSIYPHIELSQLLLYSSLVYGNDTIDEGLIAPIAYVPNRRGTLWHDESQSDLFIHVSHGGRLLTMGGIKDIGGAKAGKAILKKGNPSMKETNPQHVSSHVVHPFPGAVAAFHAHWAYSSEEDLKSDLAALIDNFEAIGTKNSYEIYTNVKYGLGVGYLKRRKKPGGEAAFITANAMRQLFGLQTHQEPM